MQTLNLNLSVLTVRVSRQVFSHCISQAIFLFFTAILFWPTLAWMARQLSSEQHRFQMLGMVILASVVIYRRVSSIGTIVTLEFHFAHQPLLVFVTGCMGYLANEHFIGIQVFSAAFCIVALFGLWGFYNDKTTWRESMVPAALLILLLPFGDYLDVYFGFPLRLYTAQTAGDFLSALGFASVSTDTLIMLDNRFANVELSCSGIKGLWAGLLFFVLLTWIERKAVTFAWWWRLICFCGVLITMNVFRIAIIVMLGLGFQKIEFADLLHQGLGILGFAFSCVVGWILLFTAKSRQLHITNTTDSNVNSNRTYKSLNKTWFQTLPGNSLVVKVIVPILPALFCLAHSPLLKDTTLSAQEFPVMVFPEDWRALEIPLSPQEAEFFPRTAAAAKKYHFKNSTTLDGSVIFVSTRYWKAHHDPRNCLQSQGYHIVNEQTVRLADKKSLHLLSIRDQERSITALYWFQSAIQMTDDFSARLFASLINRQQQWIMVSVVLDKKTVSMSDIDSLMKTLSPLVSRQLNNPENNL